METYFERISDRAYPAADSLEMLPSSGGQAPCLCASSEAGGKIFEAFGDIG